MFDDLRQYVDWLKAKNLITAAKECGADYAKFQFYDTDNLVVHSHKKAKYQLRADDGSDSHFDMLKKYQFRIDDLNKEWPTIFSPSHNLN